MGCCGASSVGIGDDAAEAQARRDDEIKKGLDETEDADKGVMKLLLLGAGESGKSTLFKQMKVINKDGYSDEERRSFQSVVWSNTITAIKAILEGFEKLAVPMPPEVAEAYEAIRGETTEREVLTPELGNTIQAVWKHEVRDAPPNPIPYPRLTQGHAGRFTGGAGGLQSKKRAADQRFV